MYSFAALLMGMMEMLLPLLVLEVPLLLLEGGSAAAASACFSNSKLVTPAMLAKRSLLLTLVLTLLTTGLAPYL